MNHEHTAVTQSSEARQPSNERNWLNSRRAIFLLAAVGIAGAVLLSGHSNHVVRLLPYLLLLACPFMHFFMHRQHERNGKGERGGRRYH